MPSGSGQWGFRTNSRETPRGQLRVKPRPEYNEWEDLCREGLTKKEHLSGCEGGGM